MPAFQTFWQLTTWWVRSTFSFKNSYLSYKLQGWLRIVELILKWCSLTSRRCIECATTCDNLLWGLCNIFTPLYQFWSSNIYWILRLRLYMIWPYKSWKMLPVVWRTNDLMTNITVFNLLRLSVFVGLNFSSFDC